MAYDEEVADRFRNALLGLPDVSEKKMMGALCFLLNGNMIGGAFRSREGVPSFLFRVGKDNEDEALGRPNATVMINGGRRMGGFIIIPDELCDDEELAGWVTLCLSFVGNLPPK
jgi:hypothetical protein